MSCPIKVSATSGWNEALVDIPERFNLEKIEAKFMDGVLKIRIAKAEDGVKKIKRIEIA
jgi:HSP20 family molecular chaperone IbpA